MIDTFDVLLPNLSAPTNGFVAARITSSSRLADREDSLGIALLSSACVTAARRSMAGLELERADRIALRRAAELFRAAIEGLRFIQTGGKEGRPPSQLPYSGFAVELLVENKSILAAKAAVLPPGDVLPELERWLQSLEDFATTGKSDHAAEVASFFLALTEIARAEAGSTGEVASPQTLL